MTTIDDGNKTISFGNEVLPIIAAISSSSTDHRLSREGDFRLLINLLSFSGFPTKASFNSIYDSFRLIPLKYPTPAPPLTPSSPFVSDLGRTLSRPKIIRRETVHKVPDLEILLKELAMLRQEVMYLRKPAHIPVLAMIDASPNSDQQAVKIQNKVEEELEELMRDHKEQITSDSSYVEGNHQQTGFSQYQLAMTLGAISQLESIYNISPKNLLWQELGTRITIAEEKYLIKLGFQVYKARKMNSFAGFDGDLNPQNGVTVLVAIQENCKCVGPQDVVPANFNQQALYFCTSESLPQEILIV
uniref:Uncharacterized protein n=1 Tax=Ditylenchus dipsaci TaxID=166011 RepID=A0A915CPU4_9BILA